ncbi:hypothetical protein DPMN_023193 [Dreissena polymorpha]|uniref:Uncharacterized protein n=1 Tax=Dreissena polymorpha TaxID=45954 RepID=A0A9D4LME8_DREPO|nr:hypothetical protein DPMN_023193 [Dreissena polymorpha]
MVTQQLRNKVAPIHVAQLSGHRIVMSLYSYHTISLEEQMKLSDNAHAINKGATVRKTNESSNTSSEPFGQDMSDDEILAASQEIEDALNTIQTFENQHSNSGVPVVNLPVVHHADVSLSFDQTRAAMFDPSKPFMNCTFNAAVQINFK